MKTFLISVAIILIAGLSFSIIKSNLYLTIASGMALILFVSLIFLNLKKESKYRKNKQFKTMS